MPLIPINYHWARGIKFLLDFISNFCFDFERSDPPSILVHGRNQGCIKGTRYAQSRFALTLRLCLEDRLHLGYKKTPSLLA